jgi:hypothetical protein
MSWGARTAVTGLILLSITVVIFLVSFLFGGVRGEEFNPYTFARRKFYFYEIPLLRVQIWPLVRNNASGDVESLVQAESYVTPKKNTAEQWHLFTFNRSAAPSPPFDAAILKTYLDARDEKNANYWHDWSERHPERAKALWPIVARFAQLKLYVVIPHFFELARTADDDAAFAKALTQEAVQRLQDYGSRRQARDDHAAAVELFEAMLELDPQNTNATELLEKSRAAL